MEQYLSAEEVTKLIERIRFGDQDAWVKLLNNFECYIYKRCWDRLKKLDRDKAYKNKLIEDLVSAGKTGFVSAVKNFDPERGNFMTYSTHYIDGAISKELDFLLNPLGLTERPKNAGIRKETLKDLPVLVIQQPNTGGSLSAREAAPVREKYSAERRTLQLLDILKTCTDETHSLSKEALMALLKQYRILKYDNGVAPESPNTITSTLESILLELDPLEYREDREDSYRIKYAGYREDRLKKKLRKESPGKSPEITDFSYVHPFSNAQLDQLIGLLCFSDMITPDEKTELIRRLTDTASLYYRTPYWDGEKLRFHPKAIHGRFTGQTPGARTRCAENLKIIQDAINHLGQIRFRFNRYTDDKQLVPGSDYIHTLSPYHLVVYHDNYYCIGLKADDQRIWHYRVDLMSEIELVKDADGRILPIEVSGFEGLPIFNANWNPERYMAEHLYMAYDEPRNIRIKIKSTDYTVIHDWFGDHYVNVASVAKQDAEGDGTAYDVVQVRTSPAMIVHWALQYGPRVEILDEEIREAIKREIDRIKEVYNR